jgi:hypothetical protein
MGGGVIEELKVRLVKKEKNAEPSDQRHRHRRPKARVPSGEKGHRIEHAHRPETDESAEKILDADRGDRKENDQECRSDSLAQKGRFQADSSHPHATAQAADKPFLPGVAIGYQ